VTRSSSKSSELQRDYLSPGDNREAKPKMAAHTDISDSSSQPSASIPRLYQLTIKDSYRVAPGPVLKKIEAAEVRHREQVKSAQISGDTIVSCTPSNGT
jgi:hypothetical protein